MLNRISLVFTLWFTSSLALLASVQVAPIRIPGCIAVSSSIDGQRCHYDQTLAQSTPFLSATLPTDAVLEVNDLPSENEEQDRADALDEPRVSFLIPRSFRNDPDRQLISPRSILSLYPLRC